MERERESTHIHTHTHPHRAHSGPGPTDLGHWCRYVRQSGWGAAYDLGDDAVGRTYALPVSSVKVRR